MKTPASLLERLHDDADQESWTRLVQLYLPLICYWAKRAGLQDADVADLSQEVFVILVRTLPDFNYDRHKSFRNWLRTVTLNKFKELRRRDSPAPAPGMNLDDLTSPESNQLWEADYQSYLANRALSLMRTDFDQATWQACWETVVEQVPAAAVAQKLGLSVASVYTAKSRVLRRLRQELAGLL